MRKIVHILKLDAPRCQNVFGVDPCTAGRIDAGTAQAGSADSLTLRAGASAVDDFYNTMTARLADGRERRISDYVGATKVATVSPRWPENHLLHSGALDNAAWSKATGITVTPDVEDGPFGTSADEVVNSGAFNGYIQQSLVNPIGAGETYTARVFIRLVSGTFAADDEARITFYGSSLSASENTLIGFDLTAEYQEFTVTATTAGAGTLVLSIRTDVACAIRVAASQVMPVALVDFQEYVETTTARILLPDATTDYTVIDRPNACYNTRRTCRDPANFSLGSHTYRFAGREDDIPPGELVRPYITRFDFSPTQLDFEEGLGRRANTRFTSIDEADSDVEQDPYVLDRAAPAQGTFWRRFRARNLHFAGHPAQLETHDIIDGVWAAPKIEHFLIDTIDGPGSDGAWSIVLKDPTSSLDTTKTPPPTTGKLIAALGLNDLQAVLDTGDGEQYGDSGWFRHNDEVIRFTARDGDTLTWPDGTYRGQFGTAAQEAEVGDALQLCHVGIDEPFDETVRRLFNSGGMSDSQLDLAGLQSEQDLWMRGYDSLTYCIADSETTSTLVKELMVQAGMSSCWSSELQKQIFKVYAPQSPAGVVPKVLTGAGHLALDSVQIETLKDKRVTRVTVRFGLAVATANLREDKNYATGERTIMVDAEGPNQYNDVIEKEIFSRWFTILNQSAMRTLSRRMASRYVDAPENVEFYVHPKDQDLKEGDVVDLVTAKYTDVTGAPKLTRVIVTRKHRKRRHGEYRARITAFGDRRYGFIAPNGTPDYPNNAGYACIASNAGLMSDGTEGFRIW